MLVGQLAACTAATLPADRASPAEARDIARALGDPTSPSSLGRNGLRVGIEPSFGAYSYTVRFDVRPANCAARMAWSAVPNGRGDRAYGRCRSVVARVRRLERLRDLRGDEHGYGRVDTAFVAIPVEEYEAVGERIDRAFKGGRSTGFDTDGTTIAVERMSAGRLQAYVGNASAGDEDPAPETAAQVQRLLLAYGPRRLIPPTADWHVDPAS